jgi:drug/metabolite transporter (DMT)-like permease
MWLLFAFSGPIFWAASTHIDKYLVEKYFKYSDVVVLMVFTALIGILMLPFILWFGPDVFAMPAKSILVIIFSGILYMGAILFYLKALQNEEASVVAPFYQAGPLFGYILAYFILGEKLSHIQMAGGLLIFTGALLLSIRFGKVAGKFKKRLVVLMLTCAFVMAVSSVIFKVFAVRDEFWPVTFWTYVGEAIFGIIILAIPSYFRQFINMLRVNTGAVLSINGANELINLGGGLGFRYALLFAPLSIVQAIGSTTTLFVFIIGILLSVFIPSLAKEDISAKNLIQKGVAAILITIGVILINF